jgi:hypothetical protein
MRPIRRLVGIGLLIVIAVGCNDRGFGVIAENHATEPVLARVTMSVRQGSVTERVQHVMIVPPHTRPVVAYQGFAGDQISSVEILRLDCTLVESPSVPSDGALIVILPGPQVRVRKEWPDVPEVTAEASELCP